ncbi:MAG: NAD(P)H-dependent oxidoreductase [Lachnospiraceae bacterium]|nr:NAD(P)H-dependent oxidoreductase [Lachnospiraceae bacterium]
MMKIVIIHGQNHEGSTCMAARELANKVGGEICEFFLPRDFNRSCLGCYTCFKTDLRNCPHYRELEPLVTAILDADLLILASPVYVYHATGPMMSFLDHFGTWWMVHRPLPEMSNKQAVAIATAAGGGMKSTLQDMADSLEMWGIRKVYKLGFGVQAIKADEIPDRILRNIHGKTDRLSRQIRKNAGRRGCNVRAKKWFYLIRLAHKHCPHVEPDYHYWEKQNWHGKNRPWREN